MNISQIAELMDKTRREFLLNSENICIDENDLKELDATEVLEMWNCIVFHYEHIEFYNTLELYTYEVYDKTPDGAISWFNDNVRSDELGVDRISRNLHDWQTI